MKIKVLVKRNKHITEAALKICLTEAEISGPMPSPGIIVTSRF